MSESTAIGKVSESLRNLLEGEMKLKPKLEVTVLAPDEGGNDSRINLFLYKVQENPALKNMDWQIKPGSPNQLVPPPLSLNLFYLMTAYKRNDSQTGNSLAHEILGDAMRVFYENPIVPREYLPRGLKDSREQVKIMLNTLDLDELSKVWATFTKAFRLSVLYEVSVVQLDMLSESERAMAERVQTIGVPEVKDVLPYDPPFIERIEPLTGTAGSTVHVFGKNFTGWNAYVYMKGETEEGKLINVHEYSEESFQFRMPTDLSPGSYNVLVDVGHLSKQTIVCEVK